MQDKSVAGTFLLSSEPGQLHENEQKNRKNEKKLIKSVKFAKDSSDIRIRQDKEKVVILVRIDAMNQISKVYQTKGSKKYSQTGRTDFSDKLEISQLGKDIQVAKAAVAQTSDVREDKVAAIKAAMESGTYAVKDDDLVEKLMGNFDFPF